MVKRVIRADRVLSIWGLNNAVKGRGFLQITRQT